MNERKLDAELRFHFDQLVADYIRQGMALGEAVRNITSVLLGVGRTDP